MSESSHSPTDMPERRAAASAASRASCGISSTSHETPDVMPASTVRLKEERDRTAHREPVLADRWGRRATLYPRSQFLRVTVNVWLISRACVNSLRYFVAGVGPTGEKAVQI